ncbi:MAG TPA: SIMPL domain-containing protein [Gemmatirosa sp.]
MSPARPPRTATTRTATTRSVLAVLAGTAALTLGVATRARAQTPTGVDTFNPGAAITVSGTGEDQVAPDRARVSLGVVTQATTAAAAAQQNARVQQAVLDAVRAQGIAADQISTSGYNVTPTTEYNQQTQRSRVTGYSVQNTVTVELRRIDQVGPVLDAVLAKGANTVSSLELYSSQAEASRRRALAKAVERARADAEAMAAAAGGRLGLLLDLSSGAGYVPPRPMMMAKVLSAAAPATPISEGLETNSATVTARWQFLPAR